MKVLLHFALDFKGNKCTFNRNSKSEYKMQSAPVMLVYCSIMDET